jgi:hypothetical protein
VFGQGFILVEQIKRCHLQQTKIYLTAMGTYYSWHPKAIEYVVEYL